MELIPLCRLNGLWILSRYGLVPKDAVVSLQCQEQMYCALKDRNKVEKHLRWEGMNLTLLSEFSHLWLGKVIIGTWGKDILLKDLRNNVSMCHQKQCSGCEQRRLKIIQFIMILHSFRNLFYIKSSFTFWALSHL